jgi:hypothetical protein
MECTKYVNQNTLYSEPEDIQIDHKDTHDTHNTHGASLQMASGYKKVAMHSVCKLSVKEKHRLSKSKSEYRDLLESERKLKSKKVKAIAQGTWISRLSHVARFDDPEPLPVHIPTVTYKTIGRFTVGLYS